MSKKQDLPGDGLFGWLGRQVGYISHAIKTDPSVVASKKSVEEKADPDHPELVFRRTTIDEVRRREQGAIEKKPSSDEQSPDPEAAT